MAELKKPMGVDVKDVKILDGFWGKYSKLVRDTVIPYQWEALNDRVPDAEPSHSLRNFRIAAGEEEGQFGGLVFQDTDPYKWLEAVGYSLATHPDPQLEELADGLIDLIGRAQQADGYINTYYTIKEAGNRWTNLFECHEMYCAGHLIEAAVSYYEGTGKRKLLEIACRFADYIDTVFGPEPEKLKGYDGHEEIKLALIKLYKATGNERYVKLAAFFMDERGRKPYYFIDEWKKRGGKSYWKNGISAEPDLAYCQAHKPVREQTEAVGHAVRAMYLYTAMADMAALTGDEKLVTACGELWDSIVNKRMYITGGIGSTYQGEAFTFDYDLPNDTTYQETCASIGLILFANRMLKLMPDGKFADVMERALYNSVISGMSQDGQSFFYVNPLEVLPEACMKDPGKQHVKPLRQRWYGCACCPPNITRLLSSLGGYIYTTNENTIYTHLYINAEARIRLDCGRVTIVQQSSYPWDGEIELRLNEVADSEFTLALRIPGWCSKAEVNVNGKRVDLTATVHNGYVFICRTWSRGDVIKLQLKMPVEFIQANPLVRADAGKVAIQRGPLVYCLEETDNGAGLASIKLDTEYKPEASFDPDFFGGAVIISGRAFRDDNSNWTDSLYRPLNPGTVKDFKFRAIPYYLWANRETGEMQVWSRYR